MGHLQDITFDCSHPASLARFWAAALDDYEVAPYDEDELERLKAVGVFDVEDDPSVLVQGPAGSPRLWFQRVPEPKTVKNRVHLDLVGDVDELVALGATVLERHDDGLVVLTDPEGNEFCVVSST